MSRERRAAFKIAYYHTMHTSIPQCSVHEKVRCFAKMCNIKEHKEQVPQVHDIYYFDRLTNLKTDFWV